MPNKARLIFMHIPKTAGISMTSIIKANYRKNELGATRFMWQGNPDFQELTETERRRINMLCGHMPFGIHQKMGEGPFEYFTMLREPVERVLSAYNDILTHEDHFLHKELKENRNSFRELAENGKWLALDNCQVRMISGSLLIPFGQINASHLETALQNIDRFFPLVGVQHRFDEFVLQLSDRYGWKFPYYRKLHVTPSRKFKSDLDEEELAAIRRCNTFDQILFDKMSARAEKTIADAGEDFQKRLSRYRRRNRFVVKALNLFYPQSKPKR
ncbi:MAG: hypothetical protein FD123_1019 [Bacteroidetes bacterium]|nr:MAG: hypothetical protein FD123_1019 [Bacteroidota bacterium]